MSGRSILSLTSRSAALSWRLGQSSPRLQAGDAPSSGSGFAPRGAPSHYVYAGSLRRPLGARGNAAVGAEPSDRADDLDLEGVAMDAPGYMSDGDVLSKNARPDDVSSG